MPPTISLNIDQVLSLLPEEMEITSVPGLVITAINDHQIATTYPMGVKNTDTGAPVTAETVFQAASLSKPVFAYGVLRLQAEGGIDLDRPLHSYLPIPETNDEPQFQTITARHVLSHSSGWQNWRFEPGDPLQSAFPPGEHFAYSGEGYFYLQRVVEQITDQAIEAYLRDNVLRLLGMDHSSYIWLAEHEDTMSMGHRDRGQPAEPWNLWQGRRILELAGQMGKPAADWRYEDVVRALPQIHTDLTPLPNNMIPNVAASLLTTGPEYARFVIRILAEAEGFARLMLTPQVHLNRRLTWGLGWGLETEDDGTTFWHWGDNNTFKNFIIGDPRRGSGLIILTNGQNGMKLCERIVRRLTGHEHSAFLWL